MAHTDRANSGSGGGGKVSGFHKAVFMALCVAVVIMLAAIWFFAVKKPSTGSPKDATPGVQQKEKGVATP